MTKPPLPTFPGHKGTCVYPRETCTCGVIPLEDTEAYRRRRAEDLGRMSRMGFLRPGKEIIGKDEHGHDVVLRHELVNPRRRAINKLREQAPMSPRQLKKLQRKVTRERKAEQAAAAARKDAMAKAPISQAAVPAGMKRLESGLLVPE